MNITITYGTTVVAIDVESVAEALERLGILEEDVRTVMTPCQHEGCTAILDAWRASGMRMRTSWLCYTHKPQHTCAHPGCTKWITAEVGRDGLPYLCNAHKHGRSIP